MGFLKKAIKKVAAQKKAAVAAKPAASKFGMAVKKAAKGRMGGAKNIAKPARPARPAVKRPARGMMGPKGRAR